MANASHSGARNALSTLSDMFCVLTDGRPAPIDASLNLTRLSHIVIAIAFASVLAGTYEGSSSLMTTDKHAAFHKAAFTEGAFGDDIGSDNAFPIPTPNFRARVSSERDAV